ncbi:hypothetical protein SAMD00020551_0144 [Mesobacillus selenatarsenatis SF-1]|uniref:Uncharacterized protein n=1 Tax=Mesobacillus selenatarsenatis (strain DSM 18680 / JCM 14380 / FERM P-15431 / SF-1) TaxID=1321606 RepID=A0A0A8WWK0_MESS1|nr:hypothetical protein SAMD00020551_0144 [Mesobacillus selenatarsenatis SF-1]
MLNEDHCIGFTAFDSAPTTFCGNIGMSMIKTIKYTIAFHLFI